MSVVQKFKEGLLKANKAVLLILVPICLDVFTLVLNSTVLKADYIPTIKSFIFKFGIISNPPSVKYILEDFPSVMFSYNTQYGSTGIVSSLDLLGILLLTCFILVTAFITSGYMSCLEKAGREQVRLIDFFVLGNKNWFKYLVLRVINLIPIVLMIIEPALLSLLFILIIFYYVDIAIVVDGGSLKDNFKNGVNFLGNNLGVTIRMVFYCGFIFSLMSLILFPLASLGSGGVVVDIVIVSYLGMGFNKAMIEIYREGKKVNLGDVEKLETLGQSGEEEHQEN